MNAAPPYLVSWNLTRSCNLACAHCYLDAVQRKSQARDELGTAAARAAIGELAALAPGAMLVFTGGEPLLRGDLCELVREASSLGLMPVVGTNGTLLGERRAAGLKAAGARGAGISLDSADAAFHDRLRGKAGAWRDALRGMRAARAAGLGLLVQTTAFEENRRELAGIAAIAASHGAIAFNVFFLVCTGRGATQTDLSPAAYEETLAEIVRLQHEHPAMKVRARCAPYLRRVLGVRAAQAGDEFADWSSACLAGRRYLRITPQGVVTPCPYLPEIAGELGREPLQAIWNTSPALLRLRSELPQGKCGACDFRYSCGGCRARAFARHGDMMGEDPNCRYVTAAQAEPEPSPQPAPSSAIAWAAAAEARLQRIPAFLREHIRGRLEEHARREGVKVVTPAFMAAHRPPGIPPA
ncbi:MAG: radical SAM protein [Burkholderiales bacterium]|nr:radical SAM protein [Burkholderiales bacterium]